VDLIVATAPGSPFPAAVDATASTSLSRPRRAGSPPTGASPDPAHRVHGSANLANTRSSPQFDETISSHASRCTVEHRVASTTQRRAIFADDAGELSRVAIRIKGSKREAVWRSGSNDVGHRMIRSTYRIDSVANRDLSLFRNENRNSVRAWISEGELRVEISSGICAHRLPHTLNSVHEGRAMTAIRNPVPPLMTRRSAR